MDWICPICWVISPVACAVCVARFLDLRRHHGKAGARRTGARRFDGGIQRQQIGLVGDGADQRGRFSPILWAGGQRDRQWSRRSDRLLVFRVVGDDRGLVHLPADLDNRNWDNCSVAAADRGWRRPMLPWPKTATMPGPPTYSVARWCSWCVPHLSTGRLPVPTPRAWRRPGCQTRDIAGQLFSARRLIFALLGSACFDSGLMDPSVFTQHQQCLLHPADFVAGGERGYLNVEILLGQPVDGTGQRLNAPAYPAADDQEAADRKADRQSISALQNGLWMPSRPAETADDVRNFEHQCFVAFVSLTKTILAAGRNRFVE